MSYATGPRNPLWRHGRGTVQEVARQMIRAGHGLRRAGLREWRRRVKEFGTERVQRTNPLRELIEQRYHMSRSLDDLRPEIRPMVDGFLVDCATEGIQYIITCTTRPLEDQAALYAQGRTTPGKIVTNARPGQSAHNFGLAIDIVPIANGKPDWDGGHPIWQRLGALGQARGLQWLGATDSRFKEQAHFQHPNWKAIAGVL